MKRNRALIGICIAVGITTGLGFKFRQSQGQGQTGQQQSQAIPEYEIYRQLFHHHVTMKRKAEELEKQGKDARFLREFYKREAKLNDDQARAFDAVASDCEQQVARQDAKAKAIIDAALAKNGNGKLQKDARPPEAPPELRSLWDERNAIITRAKYALQAALGDTEFTRFENYVKKDVEPRIVVAPNHPRPTPMGPRHGPRAVIGPSPTPEGR